MLALSRPVYMGLLAALDHLRQLEHWDQNRPPQVKAINGYPAFVSSARVVGDRQELEVMRPIKGGARTLLLDQVLTSTFLNSMAHRLSESLQVLHGPPRCQLGELCLERLAGGADARVSVNGHYAYPFHT